MNKEQSTPTQRVEQSAWNVAAYEYDDDSEEKVVSYRDALQLATEFEVARKEVKAVLELCPNYIQVREGGAEENIYASLAVTVAGLRQQLAELKKDKKRLDWFDSQYYEDSQDDKHGGRELIYCYWQICAEAMDIRSAIDATMKGEQK